MPTVDDLLAQARGTTPTPTVDDLLGEARRVAVPTEVARARLKTAQEAPLPETTGPGLLKTSGQAIAGELRGIPAGLIEAASGGARALRSVFRLSPEPEGPPTVLQEAAAAIAGEPEPTRGNRPYRAGLNVGRTVGAFAAAPVTFPLTVGAAVLNEMKDQLHIGAEHSMTGELWNAIAGLIPPLGGAAELKQQLAQPGLTPEDKDAIWEDWWATKAPALMGATAGVGAGAGAWAKSRMTRAETKMAPVPPPADLAAPKVEAPPGTVEAANEAVAGLKIHSLAEDRASAQRIVGQQESVMTKEGRRTALGVARQINQRTSDLVDAFLRGNQQGGHPPLSKEELGGIVRAARERAAAEIAAEAGVTLPPPEPPGPAKPAAPTPPKGPDPAAALAKIEASIMGERPETTAPAPSRFEKLRTQLSSEFTPVRSAEASLRERAGLPKATHDIARKLELVAGAGAKAKADVLDFQREVVKPLGKDWLEFEKYAALKRIEDRLTVDPEARKVAAWTPEEAKAGLEGLRQSIGDERFAKLQEVGEKYQALMDRALTLQVESGRMAQDTYNAIKGMNKWYAPFEVVKYLTAEGGPGGTGRPIATRAELTQAIQGISSEDWQIGSIIRKSAEQIERSRILAEKNRAMLAVDDVAALDKKGEFFRPMKSGERVSAGFKTVGYFKDGVEQTLAVPEPLHKAIQGMNRTEADLSGKAILQAGRTTLRWGATTANMYFNIRNLFFADLPRAALVSYYGIRGPKDIINFPLDYTYAFWSSLRGNFGAPNDLYMEWLRSGAANSTLTRQLQPQAYHETLKLPPRSVAERAIRLGKQTLNTVPDLSSAFEETAKIVGLRRAYRLERIDRLPEAQRQAKLDEIATEIRNYSGSPDFARRGAAIDLNLLFMFFNARIQGVTSDMARLGGATGSRQAAAAYARLLPVAIAYTKLQLINMSDEERENYDRIPRTERDRYGHIPRHNADGSRAYFNTEDGELVADYWRFPKREIIQMIFNTIDSSLEFARDHDPENLKHFAGEMMGNILPVNVTGDTLGQRIESVASSVNPVVKGPLEYGTGRDFYRHRDTVPMWLEKASPEEQYTPETPEAYVRLGELTGQSPMKLQQLITGMTGGITRQFQPAPAGRDIPGPDFPMAMFLRSSQVNRDAEREALKDAQTQAADEAARRRRDALREVERIESAPAQERGAIMSGIARTNPKLAKRVMEMFQDRARGITPMDEAIGALPPEQRGAYIAKRMEGMTAEQQGRFMMEMGRKGLLSRDTLSYLRMHPEVFARP